MRVVKGGYNLYGLPIGILMLESGFPRVPGDLGNATTFSFPIRHKVVEGADHHRVVIAGDPSLAEPFVQAAKELEAEGVRAITTNCGFLAPFQKDIQAAVSVPVFTSSLILVPLIHRMLPKGKIIGILTVDSSSLSERHYNGVGWSSKDIPVVVTGMEHEKLFRNVFKDDHKSMDVDEMEAEIVSVARRFVAEHPDIGAILFECTNMAPYAAAVQEAVGLPVFDVQLLIEMVASALHRKPYLGYM